MPGISSDKRPPAPDLSSAGGEQSVVAQSSERDQFFHHTRDSRLFGKALEIDGLVEGSVGEFMLTGMG